MLEAKERDGFVLLDRLVTGVPGGTLDERKESYRQLLRKLKPGVTKLIVHLAKDDPEIRAVTERLAAALVRLPVLDRKRRAGLTRRGRSPPRHLPRVRPQTEFRWQAAEPRNSRLKTTRPAEIRPALPRSCCAAPSRRDGGRDIPHRPRLPGDSDSEPRSDLQNLIVLRSQLGGQRRLLRE